MRKIRVHRFPRRVVFHRDDADRRREALRPGMARSIGLLAALTWGFGSVAAQTDRAAPVARERSDEKNAEPGASATDRAADEKTDRNPRETQDASDDVTPSEPPPVDEPRDEDLGDKLIDEAAGRENGDVMSSILALMDKTARRLDIDFDPGEQTQAMQRRIIDQLDDAIRQAARHTRKQPSGQSGQGRQDKRSASSQPSRPGADRPTPGEEGKTSQAKPSDSGLTTPGKGSVKESALDDVNPPDHRRVWGNLPPRDRDEVIEGLEEAILPRYREWIERYYRALQDVESAEP